MLKILYAGCFRPFIAVLPLKCVTQAKIVKKITQSPYFWGLKSFMVIDVGTSEKLVASACYGKQQNCAYVQPLSR